MEKPRLSSEDWDELALEEEAERKKKDWDAEWKQKGVMKKKSNGLERFCEHGHTMAFYTKDKLPENSILERMMEYEKEERWRERETYEAESDEEEDSYYDSSHYSSGFSSSGYQPEFIRDDMYCGICDEDAIPNLRGYWVCQTCIIEGMRSYYSVECEDCAEKD